MYCNLQITYTWFSKIFCSSINVINFISIMLRLVYVNSKLPSNGYRDSSYQKYLLHTFFFFFCSCFRCLITTYPTSQEIPNNTSNKENLYTGGFALCFGKHWLGRGSRLSFCLHILSFRILYMDKATFAVWLQTTYGSSHSKTTR